MENIIKTTKLYMIITTVIPVKKNDTRIIIASNFKQYYLPLMIIIV
jgi:hypothetical protein